MEAIELLIKNKSNDYILILSFIFALLILISNGFLIFYIYKKGSKLTDIDKMMCLDCVFCMFNIIALIRVATEKDYGSLSLCYTLDFFLFFCYYFKLFLTKGIVVYRYVSVVKYSWIQNSKPRKIFIPVIMSTIFLLSSTMTGFVVYYREQWISFLSKYK